MEKYKYTFFNQIRQIDECEATTLDEAMKKVGVEQYVVTYQFPGLAVISLPKNQFHSLGVKWEEIN